MKTRLALLLDWLLLVALMICSTIFATENAAAITPKYLKFSTEHFDVELDESAAEYRPYLEAYLELGYRLFQKYTTIDYNEMMNKVDVGQVHKSRYFYQLPTSENMWTKGFGGGLTYWNNSQMNVALVKMLDDKSMRENQVALSILWHELGNGWANVYVSHDGKPTNVPQWFGAEGHAGFLRATAMVEIGYPEGQIEEYNRAISAFKKYLRGEKHDPGGVCNVFIRSIYQSYGWTPLRAVYRALQKEGLKLPKDSAQASGIIIAVMSKSVGQNMVPFFENYKVKVTLDAKTIAELSRLPVSRMKLATEIRVPEAFRSR